MQIDGMYQRRGPEFSREAGTIEQRADLDGQCIVVDLHPAVLQGTIGTRWFDNVSKLVKHCSTEIVAPSQFSSLICPDDAITEAELAHKRL